ncbi:MAG: Fic family protein [FCB group bacterium]|nr:Fic family protein [FCB group bacterium]
MYIPEVKYSHQLVLSLSKIDRICGILQERKVNDTWEKAMRFNTRCRSIADALNLEGTDVSLKSVTNILEGSQTANDLVYVQDVLNYDRALSYVDLLANSGEEFSEKVLLEFNRMCLEGVLKADRHRGDYRTIQNWVVNSEQNEIIYTPPSPEQVPDLMKRFADWFNGTETHSIHPVIQAGIAHHWLQAANPFVYGTARCACLMVRYILQKFDCIHNRWGAHESIFCRDLKLYYCKLFDDFSLVGGAQSKITAWVAYFVSSVEIAVEAVLDSSSNYIESGEPVLRSASPPLSRSPEKLHKKSALRDKLNQRQRSILEFAKKYEKFHRRDINAELDIAARYNPKTISRDLRAMVDLGLLNQGGERKGVYYTLNNEVYP